ncbi:MAG: hypothetical protein K0R57_4227 [Paenibacillaceae bacterium]|jgi:hypothetical protein|nr:hypothetical protein [Paenibacillaceae bacterium]
MQLKFAVPVGLFSALLIWLLFYNLDDPLQPSSISGGDPAPTPVSNQLPPQTLWSMGREDGSSAEFTDYAAGEGRVLISSNAQAAQQIGWKTVPKGLNAALQPSLEINYRLDELPAYGVMLKVKILDAHKSVPQMAVFSNSMLSGIVQIAGVGGTESDYPYIKTYELYIPKEQLQQGDNKLSLETLRCSTCTAKEDPYLWWIWDYLQLEGLQEPAAEPVHGRVVYSGTTVNNQSFYYDEGAVNHLPYVLKWLGIAYSGNVMRTGCGTDVSNVCSSIKEYYETLRDYNTRAVTYHLYTGSVQLKPDGSLPDAAADKMKDYLGKYGSLFQYYEIDNEPGLFNRSKAVNLALARWLNENKGAYAPDLQTVAPGWAYWPDYATLSCKNQSGDVRRCGDPDGWEADPKQRMELEEVTDLTNGHSYGESYVTAMGASFVENLKTFGGATEGLPKQMLNTEYGTSDSHTDSYLYGASDRKAAAFDRIMRAHIGYADIFVQHAAFFPKFSLFEHNFNLQKHNPALTSIYYNEPEQDSRVRIMRRLNLAYATHGTPLAYKIENREQLKDKLVYVRAVDTSALEPLPVTGGTSKKILVNLVNFGQTKEQVSVSVTMPRPGGYQAERFGSGSTYEASRSYITGLQANPGITFSETLQPGDSVQFILEAADQIAVEQPSGLSASVQSGGAVKLDWLESEGAAGYDILRSPASGEQYQAIAEKIGTTHYEDKSAVNGQSYRYMIRAHGTTLVSNFAEITSTDLIALDRSKWTGDSNVQKSNPAGAFDDTMRTRWDTGGFQEPGQYFDVNLGSVERIERIVLDTSGSPGDYPQGYEIYLSADGKNWGSPVAKGKGSSVLDIQIPPRDTQYVRIMQTGSIRNYWSIHELNIYGR